MEGYKEWAQSFSMDWLNELLYSIEKNCSQEECALLLNPCGACHYQAMEQLIDKYVGDLDGFIQYMSEENGQIITYSKDGKTLLVNENKSYCVCPITQCMNGKKVSPVLCNCSSSMTGKMISKIVGKQVNCQVVSSA
jgi:hypothetical protein